MNNDKLRVKVTSNNIDIDDLFHRKSIDEVVDSLLKHKQEGIDFEFIVHTYHDSTQIEIVGYRLEKDEEQEARLQKEKEELKRINHQQEQREFKTYLALKKKFEGSTEGLTVVQS